MSSQNESSGATPSKREEYLRFCWEAYPAAPRPSDYTGRVEDVSDEYVQVQGRRHAVTRWLDHPERARHLPWSAVLKVHDWVAIVDDAVRLLAPCLSPPLVDQVREVSVPRTWAHARQATRTFFAERAFLEVVTPTLVRSGSTEPWIEPFAVQGRWGDHQISWELPSSPEMQLKKLISIYGCPIWEWARSFRNGDVGEWHQPEFTMLEWYEPFRTLEELQTTLRDWLVMLAQALAVAEPRFRYLRWKDVFEETFGITAGPDVTEDVLRAALKVRSQDVPREEVWLDLFSRVTLEMESRLNPAEMTFVTDFPVEVAQMSRLGADGWAARFELYGGGLELANGFDELTDPEEQGRRWQREADAGLRAGRQPRTWDPDFLRALRSGLPPCVGVAVGVDRVLACLLGWSSLAEGRSFAVAPSDFR